MNNISTKARTSMKKGSFGSGKGRSVNSGVSPEKTNIPSVTKDLGDKWKTPLQKGSNYIRHEDADNAASHPRVTKGRTLPS